MTSKICNHSKWSTSFCGRLSATWCKELLDGISNSLSNAANTIIGFRSELKKTAELMSITIQQWLENRQSASLRSTTTRSGWNWYCWMAVKMLYPRIPMIRQWWWMNCTEEHRRRENPFLGSAMIRKWKYSRNYREYFNDLIIPLHFNMKCLYLIINQIIKYQ